MLASYLAFGCFGWFALHHLKRQIKRLYEEIAEQNAVKNAVFGPGARTHYGCSCRPMAEIVSAFPSR